MENTNITPEQLEAIKGLFTDADFTDLPNKLLSSGSLSAAADILASSLGANYQICAGDRAKAILTPILELVLTPYFNAKDPAKKAQLQKIIQEIFSYSGRSPFTEFLLSARSNTAELFTNTDASQEHTDVTPAHVISISVSQMVMDSARYLSSAASEQLAYFLSNPWGRYLDYGRDGNVEQLSARILSAADGRTAALYIAEALGPAFAAIYLKSQIDKINQNSYAIIADQLSVLVQSIVLPFIQKHQRDIANGETTEPPDTLEARRALEVFFAPDPNAPFVLRLNISRTDMMTLLSNFMNTLVSRLPQALESEETASELIPTLQTFLTEIDAEKVPRQFIERIKEDARKFSQQHIKPESTTSTITPEEKLQKDTEAAYLEQQRRETKKLNADLRDLYAGGSSYMSASGVLSHTSVAEIRDALQNDFGMAPSKVDAAERAAEDLAKKHAPEGHIGPLKLLFFRVLGLKELGYVSEHQARAAIQHVLDNGDNIIPDAFRGQMYDLCNSAPFKTLKLSVDALQPVLSHLQYFYSASKSITLASAESALSNAVAQVREFLQKPSAQSSEAYSAASEFYSMASAILEELSKLKHASTVGELETNLRRQLWKASTEQSGKIAARPVKDIQVSAILGPAAQEYVEQLKEIKTESPDATRTEAEVLRFFKNSGLISDEDLEAGKRAVGCTEATGPKYRAALLSAIDLAAAKKTKERFLYEPLIPEVIKMYDDLVSKLGSDTSADKAKVRKANFGEFTKLQSILYGYPGLRANLKKYGKDPATREQTTTSDSGKEMILGVPNSNPSLLVALSVNFDKGVNPSTLQAIEGSGDAQLLDEYFLALAYNGKLPLTAQQASIAEDLYNLYYLQRFGEDALTDISGHSYKLRQLQYKLDSAQHTDLPEIKKLQEEVHSQQPEIKQKLEKMSLAKQEYQRILHKACANAGIDIVGLTPEQQRQQLFTYVSRILNDLAGTNGMKLSSSLANFDFCLHSPDELDGQVLLTNVKIAKLIERSKQFDKTGGLWELDTAAKKIRRKRMIEAAEFDQENPLKIGAKIGFTSPSGKMLAGEIIHIANGTCSIKTPIDGQTYNVRLEQTFNLPQEII